MLHPKKSPRARRFLLGVLLSISLGLTACDNFVLYDELNAAAASAAAQALPLTLAPANVAVKTTEGVAFAASGGDPDYVFTVASGGGTVDAQSGYYTAPATAGAAVVRVSDAAGDSAQANVTVVTPSELVIRREDVTVEVSGSFLFSGTGGISPYTFALAINNSGGSITGDGSYNAGSTPGTDTVVLTDNAGTNVYAYVDVVSGGPLGISPTTPTVDEGATIDFSGYGGTPGYTFSILLGPGVISSGQGLYTAPGQVGSDLTEVQIRDTASATVTTLVTVLPAAPTNLEANGAFGSNSQIQLTWDDNSAAEDGYRIERKLNGGTFAEIATVGADVSSYTDSSCSPNVLYIYRVSAYTSGADPLQSGYSNEAYDFSN